MKKLCVIVCFVLMCSLSSCTGNSAKDIRKSEDAYESMSCAVEIGDYQLAMEYYNNGASDAADEKSVSLYYHALAMQNFSEKGCLGHSYDLIEDKSNVDSAAAENLIEQIRTHTCVFDGVYQIGSYYFVYFSDGKIAGKEGGQLWGETYCTGELVVIDSVYYWANHNDSGADILLYKVEKTQQGIKLTAVDSSNSIFEGEYESYVSDMPDLKY